ncbi:MAG TPA: DUF2380 domain-containing protein [Stellaceae bacterium]|nr:DUF2380 domain-containing protein [Stellaceae bacterium]
MLALVLLIPPARAAEPLPVAVLELDYADTSGEPGDTRQLHAARLAHFTEALRADLAKSGKFKVVTPSCDPAPCAAGTADPSDLFAHARQAGARFMILGGVHKMSTLVQWAKVQMVDVVDDKVVLDKLVTFRGDDDEAWSRAENFIAGEISAYPAGG